MQKPVIFDMDGVHLFHKFLEYYNSINGMAALVTSSSRGEYEALSNTFGSGSKFLIDVTSDDIEKRQLKGKPSPDPYLLAKDMLKSKGFDTDTEVMEDPTLGVYSAFDADLKVIGMTHLTGER